MPLSAKQMEYLALAWQCFETEPKIDYNKFATVAGLKTPASARELMRVTKNKLRDEYGALSSGLQTSNGATTPKTPTKNGSATLKAAAATPASRKRVRKSAQKPVGVEEEEDDDDDDEQCPAGKKAKAATPAENGAKRKVVKSEPLADEGQVSEAEVSFF